MSTSITTATTPSAASGCRAIRRAPITPSPATGNDRITLVLLADDHVHLQIAVTRLLEPECEMVGRATTVAELLAEAQAWHPDVVVVDLICPSPMVSTLSAI